MFYSIFILMSFSKSQILIKRVYDKEGTLLKLRENEKGTGS